MKFVRNPALNKPLFAKDYFTNIRAFLMAISNNVSALDLLYF